MPVHIRYLVQRFDSEVDYVQCGETRDAEFVPRVGDHIITPSVPDFPTFDASKWYAVYVEKVLVRQHTVAGAPGWQNKKRCHITVYGRVIPTPLSSDLF